jgi:hypothetical protein
VAWDSLGRGKIIPTHSYDTSRRERPTLSLATVVFPTGTVRLGLARRLQIGRLVSIVAETKQKIFGRISFENQERNFLAMFLAE